MQGRPFGLRGVVVLITVAEYLAWMQPYVWEWVQRRFGLQQQDDGREPVLSTAQTERLMRHEAPTY